MTVPARVKWHAHAGSRSGDGAAADSARRLGVLSSNRRDIGSSAARNEQSLAGRVSGA